MESRPAKGSVSDQVALATRQMEEFKRMKQECVDKARELMAMEDPAKGIYHNKEIFRLKQDSLRLEVEAEFCRKKINRLNLGYDQ
jgi:hypothetical protein